MYQCKFQYPTNGEILIDSNDIEEVAKIALKVISSNGWYITEANLVGELIGDVDDNQRYQISLKVQDPLCKDENSRESIWSSVYLVQLMKDQRNKDVLVVQKIKTKEEFVQENQKEL